MDILPGHTFSHLPQGKLHGLLPAHYTQDLAHLVEVSAKLCLWTGRVLPSGARSLGLVQDLKHVSGRGWGGGV
jgi:hypothetical protein